MTSARELQEHKRAMEQARRLRRMIGDGQMNGRSGLPAPVSRKKAYGVSGDVVSQPEPLTNGGQVIGVGQLLVVSATGATITAGGAYVPFDTIVYQRGFAGVVAAGPSFTWPLSAVGGAELEFAWTDYSGGGTIEIEVDGNVPAWGVIASGAGSRGRGFIPVDIASGAVVKLKVTHASATDEAADATLRLHLQEPTTAPAGATLETFFVDAKESGGGSSTMLLESGVTYSVVVTGNWREIDDLSGGVPDSVLFPSPGEAVQDAGKDPETLYAGPSAGSYPAHGTAFQFNSGSGFAHIEPVGGAVSSPVGSHVYTYEITGQGAVLSAKVVDTDYGDNNGLLRVDISEAT